MYVLCPTDLLPPTPYLHFKGFQSCDVTLSHSPYFFTVQGHTSNQCFHHSFLEASLFFSILPLVILTSWKRLLSHCYPGASILGAEGRGPQIFGRVVAGRVAGGSLESWTGREILLYLIMYTKYVRKWLLLKRNRIIWPEVAVNGQFFAWKIDDFFYCLKNQNSRKFACKTRYSFVKLPEKIEIFRKFACRNRIFFDPDPRPPPRFQTKLTPLLLSFSCFLCGIIGDHAS